MGKRLIIKGADFSENGIHVATWTKLFTKQVGAMAFAGNGQASKSSDFRSADASSIATATHLKIIINNWPSDVVQRQYIVKSNVGSYRDLAFPAAALDTFMEINSTTLSIIITKLNNSESASCIVQTPSESNPFTSEEQTKITNAGVTIKVEFYKYEE